MEQTNLVVTPDGKTWDEVTRDTSYIGQALCNPQVGDAAYNSATAIHILDECRGAVLGGNYDIQQKNFAIAYDRLICLVSGNYQISSRTIRANSTQDLHCVIMVNGTKVAQGNVGGSNYSMASTSITVKLIRGDYVQSAGYRYNMMEYSNFEIVRV